METDNHVWDSEWIPPPNASAEIYWGDFRIAPFHIITVSNSIPLLLAL